MHKLLAALFPDYPYFIVVNLDSSGRSLDLRTLPIAFKELSHARDAANKLVDAHPEHLKESNHRDYWFTGHSTYVIFKIVYNTHEDFDLPELRPYDINSGSVAIACKKLLGKYYESTV